MAAGILASCNDKMEVGEAYLNGSSKTPIAVQTNLSAAPRTRAFDKTFESGDELLAYIEAGVTTGGTFSSEDNPFKGLKTFVLTAGANNTDGDNHADLYDYTVLPNGPHITETEDAGLQKLYWDDYSSTTNDLRASGAGIRLKYGYCYNGGTPSTALVETTGVLGWTVSQDQSAADGSAMKHSDLLYATTQAPVSYVHGDAQTSKHGVLVLPYAHAMSKITINVKTGEGYDASKENFASSVLTLKNMQVKADVDAPAATVAASSGAEAIKDVTTFTKSKANTKATYQAIVGPTTFTAGDILAALASVGTSETGLNNYNIPLTSGILSAWSAEDKMVITEEVIEHGIAQAKPNKPLSRATIDGGNTYTTKPGIHYILDVTVDKQKITIRATITDWESVEADGKAAINFAGDVTEKGSIADELKANGFDVYKSSSASSFTEKSTTVTFADSKCNYSPVIYWAGQSDDSYFRAISPAGNSASTLAQGTDLMWGTSGETAIAPRTGDVALNFDHLMSKLCVNLETTDDAASKVDLTGANIQITKLATTGTFSIVNGSVSASSSKSEKIFTDNDNKGKESGFTEYVVPQTIGDDARLIITLADGTTYSLQLNQCLLTDTETAVTAWTSGKSYTYTIHLEKEKITFRALVKDWEGATGSGNATLEWD